ncbi:interleukin-15 receptor subunit alpha isoform X2 [Siphateles boraxobius]|uniref:interleukin-15 receptor subunit alpha isoform X2 n=1 Tax=Siphateles boraxobius TaxID=180520 RepID=UPI0040643600
MHMLVIFIFMTAAYQHNTIARGSGFCGPWNKTPNAVPVIKNHTVGTRIRIQCAEGYVRKAGTSNLIHCTQENGDISWNTGLPLTCIPDPRNPPVTKTTTSSTQRTEIKIPTVLGTSMPTTATGHITLTTTNEVVTTKTTRTTRQTTLKSTTKEAESFTTTNEIASINSTSSDFTSRDYMTTTSSHTPSSSFTSIKGNGEAEATTSYYTSKVVGVTSIIVIICLAAAVVFLIWWWRRLRHRERDRPEPSYIPVQLVYLKTDQLNQT